MVVVVVPVTDCWSGGTDLVFGAMICGTTLAGVVEAGGGLKAVVFFGLPGVQLPLSAIGIGPSRTGVFHLSGKTGGVA